VCVCLSVGREERPRNAWYGNSACVGLHPAPRGWQLTTHVVYERTLRTLPETCANGRKYTHTRATHMDIYIIHLNLDTVTKGAGQRNRSSDSLLAWQPGGRILVEDRHSASIQTGREAHSASYKMGTGSPSRGVKRPGRGVNHPLPSSAEVKERVELYLRSPSGPSWTVLGRIWPLP
jgi:hypothetical protein